MPRIKTIHHNFDVTFSPEVLVVNKKEGKKIANPFRLRSSLPVIALNQFHRMMQTDFRIKHLNYRVTKLEKVYNDGAKQDGPEIRNEFDLPRTPTPNLLKP